MGTKKMIEAVTNMVAIHNMLLIPLTEDDM